MLTVSASDFAHFEVDTVSIFSKHSGLMDFLMYFLMDLQVVFQTKYNSALRIP